MRKFVYICMLGNNFRVSRIHARLGTLLSYYCGYYSNAPYNWLLTVLLNYPLLFNTLQYFNRVIRSAYV